MSDEIQSEGTYTVVPGQIRALSKDMAKWFAATARNAGLYAKKCRVPQNLGDGKRAVADAKKDTVRDTPRLNRYSAHVAVWLAMKAEEEAGNDANAQGVTEWRPRRSLIAERMEHHKRTSKAFGEAQWFAFDDTGKVVLSLSCGRSSALDLALAYNAAGGRLVLLAPEPVLADADTADCVAIPEDRPAAAPVAVDPILEHAGETGLVYRTQHGFFSLGRFDDGKVDVTMGLLDPTRCGPAKRLGEGEVAGDLYRWVIDTDPNPAAIEEFLDATAESLSERVYNGPASKLRAVPVAWKKEPLRQCIRFDLQVPGIEQPVCLFDPKLVRRVAGKGLIQADVVAGTAENPVPLLRIHRSDGLVGIVAGLDVTKAAL